LNQITNKQVGIINFEGYWDPLLKLINHLIEEEFMGNHNLNFFQEIKSTNNLKKFLKNI
jgi:predicted Rossmann-fold nucleotide-binding protein